MCRNARRPCVGAGGAIRSSFMAGTTATMTDCIDGGGGGSSSTVYIGRESFDTEVISGRSRVEL